MKTVRLSAERAGDGWPDPAVLRNAGGKLTWRRVMGVMLCGVFASSTAVAQQNLVQLPGVAAIAESENRDRWGLDGFHASGAIDGETDGSGDRARTASWASDNWEYTHTLAVVFPALVNVSDIRAYWGQPGQDPCTPSALDVEAFSAGDWRRIGTWQRSQTEPVSLLFSGNVGSVAAIRVVQEPATAAKNADRRLWIAELEVTGAVVTPAQPVDADTLSQRISAELRASRAAERAARVAPALAVAMQGPKASGFQAIIDRSDLARGRRNVERRPWASALRNRIVADADWWVKQPDDYVYGLVPEGNPRAICPSFEKGCPLHGGARRTFSATLERPYRWVCSKGQEAWYDGCTVTNPGTGEEIVVRDDGNGWLAPAGFPEAGRRYYFTAAYRYFLLGKLFSGPYEPDGGSEYRGRTPVVQLALAHALTGDPRYAHTAGVMLVRLANLYPDYDGCVEGPTQRQDGYIGQTFERFLVQNLILACDLVWDAVVEDEDLCRFFTAKGTRGAGPGGALTGADLGTHLQRNLLGHIYEYLHRLIPYLDGDFWMYEMTALAALAHCLDNSDIVSEALVSDLGLRVLLTNSWFRDGKYIYDSAGYNLGNAKTPLLIAEWLHGGRLSPNAAETIDLYHAPEYRVSMLYDFLRRLDCDGRVPQIGDGGGSRGTSLRTTPKYTIDDERALVRLPEDRPFYASKLRAAAGGDLELFRAGRAEWWTLFHAEDPLPASDTVAPVPTSHVFPDGGIAILRAGQKAGTRLHVPFTFSKGSYGHGHGDKLAINLFRYGYDFSADLGYPTTWTDIKYPGWETHTASHCTVMLDGQRQRGNVIGALGFFARGRFRDVVEASCEAAYPEATTYRRTVGVVRDTNGEPLYTVDVFRAAGVALRDYLFHSFGKPEDLRVETEQDAEWVEQKAGSLAGEDVAPMSARGYSFLHDLRRCRSDAGLVATWTPTAGTSQPDRYLLTRARYRAATVSFTVTRTGSASGPRERAVLVFAVDPTNVSDRRVVMLPPERFPAGETIPVTLEISGEQAALKIAGEACGRVDVTGNPGEEGAFGFLHYYDYSWEYRDLTITTEAEGPRRYDFSRDLAPSDWARIEPTYQAGDGILRVSDAPVLSMKLHALGRPGREVIVAKAEGYGLRGQSPLEGHLILRDRTDDPELMTAFAAVIEVTQGNPVVRRVTRLSADEEDPAGDRWVGMRVELADSVGARIDYVLSGFGGETSRWHDADGTTIKVSGRFAHVVTRAGRVEAMSIVGGGELVAAGRELRAPADVVGEIVAIDAKVPALVIRPDAGAGAAMPVNVDSLLVVRNPAYVCPSVYRVTACEKAGEGTWRVAVDMPFVLARGMIESVAENGGSFATRTPVMKLRVNPGLFDGKPVRALPGSRPARLRRAVESAFEPLDAAAMREFSVGGEYEVLDVGLGDRIEIVSRAEWPASGL